MKVASTNPVEKIYPCVSYIFYRNYNDGADCNIWILPSHVVKCIKGFTIIIIKFLIEGRENLNLYPVWTLGIDRRAHRKE